jgi:DNA-binding winged helix-turn-helix (wHTH) protein
MEKLELGMTKKEVVNILGRGYKIAEKRIDSGKEIEVLSYQDSPQEYYFFLFENNSLQEWYRELIPKYEK